MSLHTSTPADGQSLVDQYHAIWSVLTSRFRLAACLLLAGNLGGAALEVLGLSALAALMSALVPGAGPVQSSFSALARVVGAVLDGPSAIGMVALCAVTFIVKNGFMAGNAWLEATFAFRLHAYFSDLTLRTVLQADYEDVTRRSPGEQLNLLTSDLTTLVLNVSLPTLTLITETLLMLAVVGFLLWAEPGLTSIVILGVGGAGVLMAWLSRRAVAIQGQRRQQMEDERMRRLRDVFNHLREVYVYRAANDATRQLRAATDDLAVVYRSFQMMSTGPRFVLEVVLIAVLLTAIVVGLKDDGQRDLIVSVGVFAASGFRLLLGANRLIMSIQTIRFGQASLARVLAAVRPAYRNRPNIIVQPAGSASSPKLSLALEGVDFRYSNNSAPVLHGLDIKICKGRMVGIKGQSGEGKTSLLEIMAGLRRPTTGTVWLDGVQLSNPSTQLFRLVGYVGQNPAVFSDTVRRNVAYGFEDSAISDAAVWAALESAHLAEFVQSLPAALDSELGTDSVKPSGGQAQRLALARALYSGCQFLLLDEPTSALDPLTETQIVATLRDLSRHCAILLVSHRPGPLLACDLVYEMRQGRLWLAEASETAFEPG